MKKSIDELISKKNQLFSKESKDLVIKGELFLKWLIDLKFEPKLKYQSDNLYIASYLYWITRIERRAVFEQYLKQQNMDNKENSRRIFKYLYKRLEHSLYLLALKNRSRIINIKIIKNNWVSFKIEGINYTFFSGSKLLSTMNLKLDELKQCNIDEYAEKVLLTLVNCIESEAPIHPK